MTRNSKMRNTKMSLSWILLATIPSCLASILELIRPNDELYVVKHPTKNELTCFSEDDDAALVWNYNLSTTEPSDNFNNFEPVKPMENISLNSECAILKSRQCFIEWSESSGWQKVSAATNPMAPVYDFRWEGFKEYVVNNVGSKYILPLDAENGTIIFSIRGTSDVQIHLCEDTKVGFSSCPVIKFAVDGVYSSIEYCESRGEKCREQARAATPEAAFFNADEWRTFRLQWIKNERKIEVFRDTYRYVSVKSSLRELHNIFISSSTVARIRFHDYNYILTTNTDSIMTTKEFDWSNESLCIHALVSLCAECELSVVLIDSSTNVSADWSSFDFKYDDEFHPSGLREWRSAKLSLFPLHGSPQRRIRMKLRPYPFYERIHFTEDLWWAIGDLSLCEQNDGVRKSTIKLPSSDQTGVRTNIKCQKLLRGKTALADLSTSLPSRNTTRLSEYVKNLTKSYSPECGVNSTTNCDNNDSTSDQKNGRGNGSEARGYHPLAPPADNKSPSKQIETWHVGLILILVICLLLVILLIWYRKHKTAKMQTIDLRVVPSDLRRNLEEQTSCAQNVPLEPPYMIPRNPSEQTSHLQNVALTPVYTYILNDSREESSHAQNVLSDPEYWEISNNSTEQPSHPQDVALAPIYTNTSDNSKGESSYSRDASLDPEYLIILDDSKKEMSYAQDIPLVPVYMNISDNPREQTRHAHNTP